MKLGLCFITGLVAAQASAAPTCAAGQARESGCSLPPQSVGPLAADVSAQEALALAQRTQRALLAPRVGGVRARRNLPPIGFVKTHKTGGSTMANILHRLALTQNLSIVPTNEGVVTNWQTLEQTEAPRHQYDLMCHHEIFNVTAARAYLKPSPVFFSIVREPIDQIGSKFRWQESRRNQPHTEWQARLSTMRTLRGKYSNSLARDFGWYGGVDLRNYNPYGIGPVFDRDNDTEAVAQFVAQLDRTLDLVFPTDRYDEGLVLLRRKLGVSLDDMSYLRMKETLHEVIQTKPPTDEEASQLLEEFLSVDKHIWDHFLKKFDREWEAAGGDAVLGPEVEELRRKNSELEQRCEEPRDRTKCPLPYVLDTGAFSKLLDFRETLGGDAANLSPDDIGDLYEAKYNISLLTPPVPKSMF